jgi:O-antigen biosynthesis protein
MNINAVEAAAHQAAAASGGALSPVAVVVCAYTLDRWSDIKAGIEALRQQTLPPCEVVLVVDHNDALAARARRELCTRLTTLQVIPNGGRQGLSGARNTGIAATTAPLVAFLDDDALPEPSWLAELVAPFDDPSVFVTGGRAVPVWPDARPHWWPAEFDWVIGCSYVGLPDRAADVRNVLGCSMMLRREVFAIAGSFTLGLGRIGTQPLGCEETELCIRLRQRRPDARVTYTPRAVVHHHVTAVRTKARYFASRCFAEGASKAQVAHIVGASEATSSERSYVRVTLSRALLQGLSDTRQGDWTGLAKAGTILLGLFATLCGFSSYAMGHAWQR